MVKSIEKSEGAASAASSVLRDARLSKSSKLSAGLDLGQSHASPGVNIEEQIALQTQRINELSEYYKVHKSDRYSRRALLRLVGRRRRLLDYLKRNWPERYRELIQRLDLRT